MGEVGQSRADKGEEKVEGVFLGRRCPVREIGLWGGLERSCAVSSPPLIKDEWTGFAEGRESWLFFVCW